ncbi:ApbE family [Bifidobacterium callimiconis]|uniref:FAD:protein FMN transferase n=2 Tax=Bifidobacterium callimiconis TaxID=2306973 RepID=A0A430FB13_9BIFI|nr:ApbE family [Bifidobacterium callimiconis]
MKPMENFPGNVCHGSSTPLESGVPANGNAPQPGRKPSEGPAVVSFPNALGGGIIITSSQQITSSLHDRMASRIDEFERALSRFREDSTVSAMARSPHGGRFEFPDFTRPLFAFYDRMFAATEGAIDPCVGEDLTRLGYDANLTFRMESGAFAHLGREHGRATWDSVRRDGTTLVTTGPVRLDFGAAGKGYMVDLLGEMLERYDRERLEEHGDDRNGTEPLRYVIDAGGDLRVRVYDSRGTKPGTTERTPESGLVGRQENPNGRDANERPEVCPGFGYRPARIALEDPDNTTRAVGVLELTHASLCASAPSRRHWPVSGAETLHEAHHLLNALDGLPANDVRASWVLFDGADSEPYPTMVADGLATALFVTSAARLAESCDFQCAIITEERILAKSRSFPGQFFVA